MKKIFTALAALTAVLILPAGEFTETFSGKDLSPENWMETWKARCAGVDYVKPLGGKLVVRGLKKISGKNPAAYLDRDADFTSGDFRLSAKLELLPKNGSGSCGFQLLTENGELLIGAKLESEDGKISVSGTCGHSCTTVKNTPELQKQPRGTLEIIRKKGIYEVLFNGKTVYQGNGDTAPAASFRLQIAGSPGILTLSELSLKNLR